MENNGTTPGRPHNGTVAATASGTETDRRAKGSEPPEPPRTRWIGWCLVAGLAGAIPAGWLLAYLAALPFLLGLFFFVLLGLLVGAVMYRVGLQSPVPSTGTLYLMGTTVAAVLLATSLWAEYQAMPRSVEKRVRESFFESFTPQRRAELSRGVRSFVDAHLEEHYPPGGFVGYLRWAATSGEFTSPRVFKASTVEYRLPQRRRFWMMRVGLSLLLTAWAITSQLLGLRTVRRQDDSDEPDTVTDAAAGPQDAP